MSEVFLGGTCAGPDYRELLIPLLKVPYFNPVMADWKPEDAAREDRAKEEASANVFVITPAAIGMYSVAELTELAIVSDKPLFVMFMEVEGYQWNEHQLKSNQQIKKLLSKYNSLVFEDLMQMAEAINYMVPKTLTFQT
ncbi:putative nucleoside 2-deoxyribosyltransferase [Pseudomonas phage Psa21]|uniref:Putative nucleoside 2-deoxyribosyltransferase n=1 Tax=Pseudomonas phage Psa21 TaxID=2530023 RepID=A0A481W526_9CAUD|nr:putative nucleoside 2-deoxyribosyltransferase [Pseudomonas phage Psa21]QBJ02940.1 putative nucleoside 2-deoxyribosyltransferase [Pseudomonas phage Psa21]